MNNPTSVSPRAIFIYALAALFLCYEMALQVSPSVMTHELMRDWKIDAGGLGLMSGVYFYSYTIMQIPAGLLFDRISSRKLITTMLLVCVLGAVFFCLTDTVYWGALGRFFMGIGSAFAFLSVLVVAVKWFPMQYFAMLVGIAQLLAALGAMGGEAPLAAFIQHVGWRESLQWLALFGGILAVTIWFVVRDHPAHARSSKQVEPVRTSLRHVLRESQTWWVALYAFCGWAPITAFAALWGVPYLEETYSIGSTDAALAIAMIWIGQGITSPFIGWLSDKIGKRNIMLTACAAIGFVSTLAILYIGNVPLWAMYVLLFCFGIATAGQIVSFAVVRDNNRPSVTATAIGFNNMAVVIGGALFQPLVGFLLKSQWGGELLNGVQIYSVHAYRMSLVVVPLCFLVGLMVSTLAIKETYCAPKFATE